MTGLIISFSTYSQISNEYFKVTSSTSQAWAGGPAGSGSGVNYTFSITAEKDVKIKFDSVWIGGGTAHSFNRYYSTGNDSVLKKGDNIIIYAADYYPGEIDRYNGTDKIKAGSKPPISYQGDALILFYIKGVAYYYAVEKIQVLPYLAYP